MYTEVFDSLHWDEYSSWMPGKRDLIEIKIGMMNKKSAGASQ